MGDSGGLIDPQKAVDQLFGVGRAQVVEAVTSTKITEKEVIFINGSPVQLIGEDGASLKAALLAGRVPETGLLNRVLSSVLGNQLSNVSRIDSEVSVTSKVSTKDTLSVVQGGKVISEKTSEWSSDSEVVGKAADKFNCRYSSSPFTNSTGTSNDSSSSINSYPSQQSRSSSRISTTPPPGGPPSYRHNSGEYYYSNGSNHNLHHDSRNGTSSISGPLSLPNYPMENNTQSVNKVGKFPLDLSNLTATLDKFSFQKNSKKNNQRERFEAYSFSRSVNSKTTEIEKDQVDSCVRPHVRTRLLDLALSQLSGRGNGLSTNVDNDPTSSDYDNHPEIVKPTIFGTVADEFGPRDNIKRSLPQTPKTGKIPSPPEWALCADDDNSLVYEDGVLVSGSLNALIQHATPTPGYYPDTAYFFAFLLSSRLFIKPHDLLQKICDLGFSQQGLKGTDLNTVNKDELGNFLPHLVQLLGQWSETFPYDFRDERVMSGVRLLTHRCIALQPILRRDVTQVLHSLLNKLTLLEQHEENLSKLIAPPPASKLTQCLDIMEVCSSPLTLAQQLTHIELERLSIIGPEEFVQAFAKDNLETSYEDLKKTNNLESYVHWFNRLSYLVATQTCMPAKKKHRVKVIEYWIEVARESFNIGNFNSLMGIIAGLNMSPVTRLKKTWHKVHTAKFSVLEHQMDPSSNFSSYRSTLKAAMWRSAGAVDERQKIVIPFFSLLVKDLYFLNEGCANRLRNGHINFDKFWQLAKQVTEFMAWKQVSCPFEKVTPALLFLQTAPILSEIGLALASFESESPDNNFEKERLKLLRAEKASSRS